MEINDLTPAERRIWDAFPRGERVDFLEQPGETGSGGADWGPERTVRAEVLTALLLGGPTAEGQVAGLNVRGARITGKLNLKYAVVEHPIRLRACWFERKPLLYGAQLRVFVANDSTLPGLTANTVRVDLALRLSCCRITGPVRLAGARIAGGLFLRKAVIGIAGPAEEGQEATLQFNHADIGTDVIAMELTVHGQTRINGATVGGQINFDDARLLAPGGTALHAEILNVGTDLRAMRLEARGRVNLTGSRIPGQLNLAYARLINPGGVALRASSCVAGEVWLRNCPTIQGGVNLRRSQFDMLHIAPETWPGRSASRDSPTAPSARTFPPSSDCPFSSARSRATSRTPTSSSPRPTVRRATRRRRGPSCSPNCGATAAPCPGSPGSGGCSRTAPWATGSGRCAPRAGCWRC